MKKKNKKEFDSVQTFREIKEKISNDIKGMNFEQLSAYLNRTKLKAQKWLQQLRGVGVRVPSSAQKAVN